MSILHASPHSARVQSLFRIVIALLFMSYGTMKLFGFPPSPTPMPAFDPMSQMGVAGLLEVGGGVLLILGLLTRPVAFLLAGEMAVAYFLVHFPQSPFPTLNNGVPAVFFCFAFLYFSFAGGGAWSADAAIARSSMDRLPDRDELSILHGLR